MQLRSFTCGRPGTRRGESAAMRETFAALPTLYYLAWGEGVTFAALAPRLVRSAKALSQGTFEGFALNDPGHFRLLRRVGRFVCGAGRVEGQMWFPPKG
eukprot:2608464-Prymnesium_polylepis.1